MKKHPIGWEFIAIKDFANVITGGTPSTSRKEYWEDGTVPWLPSGDLKDCRIFEAHKFITNEGLANSAAKLMPKKSVLIALTGATTGQTGLLEFEASANQSVTGILPSKRHIPEFLFYYLQTQREKVLSLSYGGAQKHISQGFVKNLVIPLPPLAVQKEIVAILERAERLKEMRQQVNEDAGSIVQSMFAKRFGNPLNNEKEYPVKSLRDVCQKITDGTHVTPTYVEKGIPFLRVTDLTNSNDSKKFIPANEHKELIKRCKPEIGDILYTKNGTIGIAKMVDWTYEFSIFVSLCLLKPKTEIISPQYLEAFLNTPFALEQAMLHSKKGTITNLHLIEIKQIKIPLPPLKEQDKFIADLEVVNSLRRKQESSTRAIGSLFDCLMQKAFSGELVS